MSRKTQSLLPEEQRWEHRRREPGRLGWFFVSLALHAALLFFAGGWIEPGRLQTERPFVVELVPPPVVVRDDPEQDRVPPRSPPEAESEPSDPIESSPAPESEEAPAERRDAEEQLSEEVSPQGVPEMVEELAPDPTPTPSVVSEPATGDSAGVQPDAPFRREVASEPSAPPRRDVASEAARRLLAAMDTLVRLRPASDVPPAAPPRETRVPAEPGRRLGSEAGITGPLGRRGLIYLEHPDFPEWAEAEGVVAEARFKFWVSAAGTVVETQSLTKSGHPEFDNLARSALQRWRFEPLPPGQERDEWGEVRIVWGFPQAPSGPSWGR
ncbi:MAG: TonB family protein [Candidatus Eisenbacteria bacterium]|nr:TonB family protein [Candidatus Eisenbacteria bacterium]